MSELPAAIRDFMLGIAIENHSPAYLSIGDDNGLVEWGGALGDYGLTSLKKNAEASDFLPLLAGLLPLETGSIFLPEVKMDDGPYTNVYLFRSEQVTWVLLLDASPEAIKRQRMQQRTYDLSLQVADMERDGDELYQAKSELERRVGERTAELAQANRQLLVELSRRKLVEAELRESETRFRRIVDSNMIGIMFWDLGGAITEANSAFLDALGYTRDDLASGSLQWEHVTRPENRGQDEKAFGQLADYGACAPYERQFLRKDGATTTLLFGAALLTGSQKKIVCFTLDLSRYR
ncbi:MAG: PAS domain S-box protein [Rubrivivax sp.]|nr:PAS domain S-box protein [Pyrinomonadaceae bacterium]